MNNENHFFNARKGLDLAKEKLDACEYDTAIALLAAAYAEIRQLMDHAWRLKRESALTEIPPGENVL